MYSPYDCSADSDLTSYRPKRSASIMPRVSYLENARIKLSFFTHGWLVHPMPQFEQHTQFKLPCSVDIGVCNQCKTRVFCCALYYLLSQKIFSFVCCGMRELMPQYAAEHQKTISVVWTAKRADQKNLRCLSLSNIAHRTQKLLWAWWLVSFVTWTQI